MIPFFRRGGARLLLDESRRTRAMVWIMAIMVFLTALAVAFGLGMFAAAGSLDRQLAGRLTVQIVEPDAQSRDTHAAQLVAALHARTSVARVTEVDRAELAAMLKPWLGDAGLDPDLPMPAMIDVDMKDGSDAALADVERVAQGIAPNMVRVDRHARWLAPVRSFVTTLSWLAAGLVVLMVSATAAVVLLAARAGLDTHRDTIEVLHMLGSTDVQVARLFQRRIAMETLIGGAIGAVAAALLAALLQSEIGALGSEMLSGAALSQRDWIVLAFLPLLFVALATFAARAGVLRALGKTL
jgi:cell division transport system permease protein